MRPVPSQDGGGGRQVASPAFGARTGGDL